MNAKYMHTSHNMRNPAFLFTGKQKRHRSAYASAHSDQHPIVRYTSSFYTVCMFIYYIYLGKYFVIVFALHLLTNSIFSIFLMARFGISVSFWYFGFVSVNLGTDHFVANFQWPKYQ